MFVGVGIQKPLWQGEDTCMLDANYHKVLPLPEPPLL